MASAPPTSYDANSITETTGIPELPNAPLVTLTDSAVLQPPLSRLGSGPGVILILPSPDTFDASTDEKPLDPEPVQKCAEEGFAVVGITSTVDLHKNLETAVGAFKAHESVTPKDKFGLIIYDEETSIGIASLAPQLRALGIVCAITTSTKHIDVSALEDIPIQCNIAQADLAPQEAAKNVKIFNYSDCGLNFILPQAKDYNHGPASVAHTRNLVFLRTHLGGPHFDLESIWEEHTLFEFGQRSVARTMATMVVSITTSGKLHRADVV